MSSTDPIALLFGGLGKLGPGSNADTLHVLRLLPRRDFKLVVDAGCGTGGQTLALAGELKVPIHALDIHEPFLRDLDHRAKAANLEQYVATHRMDMKDIPRMFQGIDLLWSEGAAYNIGFHTALFTWRSAMASNGLAVVSELCWLKDRVSGEAKEFFRTGYPEMKTVEQNVALAKEAGFHSLHVHTLPQAAWVEDYYDILAPRAKALLSHPDESVRNFAAETLREIEVFQASNGCYGYVLFALQPR